ncbi:MAG TPA: hypothetical protein VGD91_25510 [Trebonia sp.]
MDDDDLPQRPPLTSAAARTTPLRSLLDRVDAFQCRNPQFTIAAPYATHSKLWEVTDDTGMSQWDNGFRMMTWLETRYGK